MSLNFPNPCRSYDASRKAVRFWGYESAMEASFFIEEGALRRLQPDLSPDEPGFLSAFDAHLPQIHSTAVKVHGRGRRGSYDLTAGDF